MFSWRVLVIVAALCFFAGSIVSGKILGVAYQAACEYQSRGGAL